MVDDLTTARDAPGQMVADLACLDQVGAGAPPVLRLYQWSPPALSLGRFQPESDVDFDACRARGVEVVRRPTGGRAILHGADLTYAIAMVRPAGAAGHVDGLYRTLAGALIAGLDDLGVRAEIGTEPGPSGAACFATAQGADLRVGERKVCGSAQVQRGAGVLQHGSVLLDRLPFDELDLLAPPEGFGRREDPGEGPRRRQDEQGKERLRTRSVTLAELGVSNDPAIVAAALVRGFETALDVTFASRVGR